MKKLIYIVFFIFFGAIAYQIYKIDIDRRGLVRETAVVTDELDFVEEDSGNLREKIEYFSDPRNLEKELRARFNYRLPFEKLIIVIPENGKRGSEPAVIKAKKVKMAGVIMESVYSLPLICASSFSDLFPK